MADTYTPWWAQDDRPVPAPPTPPRTPEQKLATKRACYQSAVTAWRARHAGLVELYREHPSFFITEADELRRVEGMERWLEATR